MRDQPHIRNDELGKWRLRVQGNILCTGSWDTKREAIDWVRWNNYDEGLYGEIIRNPELS